MLRDGLVLDLPLQEKDGDAFMSNDVYGHRCTNHGSNWNMEGHTFDGIDDYIDCGSDSVLLLRNDFTINVMMCPAFDIGAVGSSAGDKVGWYLNDRNFWCAFRDGKQNYMFRDAAGIYQNLSGTKTSWNTNEWYMLTLSYSVGNGCNIYVNGNLDNSGADFGILRNGTVSSGIGYYINYYSGLIDEFRIYNRALSESEIITIYNQSKRYYL